MMDIKSFANWGRAGAVIRSEKWENHKNSTNTNKISHNFLSFFYDGDSKFYKLGGLEGRPGEGGIYFFDIFLYYLINVIIKTLYISSFIVVYVIYFTHSSYWCVFDVFFSSPEKLTFG